MRAALLPLLLVLACHPPFPDSGGPEGDADTDTDADSDTDADTDLPPEELCSENWGWIDTQLSVDKDFVLNLDPGDELHLTYAIEGHADLCEMMCSARWLEEYYITDSEAHHNVIQVPLRVEKGETWYAYVHVNVPGDAGAGEEECYVATTAGEFYVLFSILGD
jgi:hypothetical protein